MKAEKKFFDPTHLALGLILVLSLWLRFSHLGSRPLYGDESYGTVMAAANSLSSIATSNFGSNLYPLLLHFLLPQGNLEIMARLPAVILGILSVWGVYLLGRLFFGKAEALLASLFSAGSVYLIYYSQQARGYTGLLFFSIMSLYFFWRSVNKNKTWLWVLYVLSTVIGIYTHFFLIIALPTHAVFLSLLILEKWLKKKPSGIVITKRTLGSALLGFSFILIATFLLYLPTRRTEGINFYSHVQRSLASLLRGKISPDPASLMAVTVQKFLGETSRYWVFILQSGFILLGIGACLKRHGKALIMLLLGIGLPFLLFSLTNPPSVYLVNPDRMFIFVLPLLFLLLAKGLTGLHSLLTRAFSKLIGAKDAAAVGNALWVPIVLGILIYQGALLEEHNFYYWKLLSLPRDREVSAYLNQLKPGTEFLYSDEYLNKGTFLILQSLRYPDGSEKGVAIIESDYDFVFSNNLSQPAGLVTVLSLPSFKENEISRLKSIFDGAEVRKLSRHLIIYFPSGGKTLYEKLVQMMKYLTDLPGSRESVIERHLVLAKIHLLADRRQEALQELEAFDLMKSQPIQRTKLSPKKGLVSEMIRKLIGPKSDNLHLQVQNTLAENIQGLLTKKADELLFEEEFEEALPLEREAEALRADTPRTALWTHLSLAESYLKKGLLSEAASEYGESLPLCPTPRYESYVLRKIINTRGRPFGYVIWKKDDLCYLRWWSETTKTFTGTVESSRSFRSIGEANLKFNDNYRHSRKKIIFRGIVEKDTVQGLTLGVRSPSRLTFSLEIRGQGEIQNYILLLPEATHPRAMPFVVECPK